MLRDLYAVYDVVVWKRLRCDMSNVGEEQLRREELVVQA